MSFHGAQGKVIGLDQVVNRYRPIGTDQSAAAPASSPGPENRPGAVQPPSTTVRAAEKSPHFPSGSLARIFIEWRVPRGSPTVSR